MMKKEVEDESFDLGSGTESALLDYQIDLNSQMRMQSIRTLINLIRKLYQRSLKLGPSSSSDINTNERM